MKLLHFADLHLDAPFAWAPPETARARRRNRREALTRIIALAEAEGVDAILCAGDLFEHERIGPDTVEFLRSAFERTDRRVFLAPGNHDWLSPRSPYALAEWSPNVHVFTEAELRPVDLADGLTLWGAAHRAPANTDDLFAGFRVDRGGVNVALAHASERATLAWQESGKAPHAPFDAADLPSTGLAHAFLGHYHLPRDAERHTYPGNPDPLDFGETGERGAVIATVAADGTVTRERRDVSVSEVHDLEVDVDGATHSDEVAASAWRRWPDAFASPSPATCRHRCSSTCARSIASARISRASSFGPAGWASVMTSPRSVPSRPSAASSSDRPSRRSMTSTSGARSS